MHAGPRGAERGGSLITEEPDRSRADRLASLETEARCPRTEALDTLSTADLVEALHHENFSVADAVERALPQVAALVDVVADRLIRGGRLFYVGAGTSGRLGVLDASECPPTFGVSPEMVQGVIAGGTAALTTSVEGAEDYPERGAADIHSRNVGPLDVVVGLAASGRTPYVLGALEAAAKAGAATGAVVNVPRSELAAAAQVAVEAVTGPEPLTGSTRMKAGTAEKMVLNLITTAAMVRMGRVYGNLMVDMRATNVKLRSRAIRIVTAVTGADEETARQALEACGWHCKTAIVMLAAGVDAAAAVQRLEAAGGWVRQALSGD